MKFSLQILPLVLFYIAYMLYGLKISAIVLTGSSALCYVYRWYLEKKHNRVDAYTLLCITVFTIATVSLNNDQIFQWKPTALFGIFAMILFLNSIFNKTSIIAYVMSENIKLPTQIWLNVDKAFCLFFATMSALNAYVLLHYTQTVWVNFKMFGILGLTFVFMFLLAIYISRYADEVESS